MRIKYEFKMLAIQFSAWENSWVAFAFAIKTCQEFKLVLNRDTTYTTSTMEVHVKFANTKVM